MICGGSDNYKCKIYSLTKSNKSVLDDNDETLRFVVQTDLNLDPRGARGATTSNTHRSDDDGTRARFKCEL